MPSSPFAELVEAADQLSLDEQQTLVDILRRRIAERARALLIEDVQEGRREFAAGQCRAATAEELVSEALS